MLFPAATPARVCDYYCEVGVRDGLALTATHKSAAAAPQASGTQLLLSSTFEPKLLQRWPSHDRAEMAFASEVALFCFPHGVRLASADFAALHAIPVATSFVLTAGDKTRMYGACIVWYEELPEAVASLFLEEMDVDEAPPVVHAPEAICLLARVPIFSVLMDSCRQLFRMRLARAPAPLSMADLEPLLGTPLPAHGENGTIQLGNVQVGVHIPPSNALPHTMSGRDFLLLFQSLEASSVIIVWALLLAEQKVVLQAKQPHVLTMAAETLSALLFPFHWQHVYIPILPARLLDILQAPVPFLMGIDEDVLAMAEEKGLIPDDVVQVDLDGGTIACDEQQASLMNLPQKQYHKLFKAIAPYCRRPADDDVRKSAATSAFPMAPPPDVELDAAQPTLAEMSEAQVDSAIAAVKAAFLRFFVSLMAKYQDFMVVPSDTLKQPAALDFFDVRRWTSRCSASCAPWLNMFAESQSFTQWLELRLAPSEAPLLEVVFFNEAIDAKLMRSAKTKFFSKASTPLLSTGRMPDGGYSGALVPPSVRTVYNASMISARPVRKQQQVSLLLVLGSGLQESEPHEVTDFMNRLKGEFARNLLWSHVDVEAALQLHVCEWASKGAEQHPFFEAHGLENLPVRKAMLDLALYANADYRAKLEDAMRVSLSRLAQTAGGSQPLCVIAQGFGTVFAIDYLAKLQALGEDAAESRSPLERGDTLAYFCTLGSPLPLVPAAQQMRPSGGLEVPAKPMRRRWPQLRGGWSNLYHRADVTGFSLAASIETVTQEVATRHKRSPDKQQDKPIQNIYLNETADFVRPMAQALSWVWQDTNRTAKRETKSASFGTPVQ